MLEPVVGEADKEAAKEEEAAAAFARSASRTWALRRRMRRYLLESLACGHTFHQADYCFALFQDQG